MLFSQTAYYAMRAVYYLLITGDGTWHLTKDIAEATKIPAPYLARIMSTLAKRGILRSRTGMGGGFCISDNGLKATLFDVVSQFDNFNNIPECMFGFVDCEGKDHLELHRKWLTVKEGIVDLLKSTTLESLKNDDLKVDWLKDQTF